jgi:hypothetical protein
LDYGEYSRLKIDAGEHVFRAKAHANPEFKLKVDVKAGKTTCIKGKGNPEVSVGLVMPFVSNIVSTFIIEEVECPRDDVLKKYKLRDNL